MITQDYIDFFSELEENNNKEWFHANKKRYETQKAQFLNLLEQLIPNLRQFEPKISPNPKDALFRINRDIRFSKDKTPYHTLFKAGFSAEGKKSQLPGFYLGISAHKIHVGGGLFMTDTEGLKEIRTLIAEETGKFVDIVESSEFKQLFPEISGDRAKRLDKLFQPILDQTPYIANKQFYAMTEMPLVDYVNKEEVVDKILACFRIVQPLNSFLAKAF